MIRRREISVMIVFVMAFVAQATLAAGSECANDDEPANLLSLLQTHLEVRSPKQPMSPVRAYALSEAKDQPDHVHLVQQHQRSASNITRTAHPVASETPAALLTGVSIEVQTLVCCGIVVIAALVVTLFLLFYHHRAMDQSNPVLGRKIVDVIAVGCCIAILVLVAIGIFGGGLSPKTWFSWHPVLMTLAFPCLMTMGRWSYKTDSSWGVEEKATRRTIHGIIMGSAGIIALLGYLCIFMAHLQKDSFFGYSFATGKWNPDSRRVAHAIFGYVVLLAMVFQACIGIAKRAKLDQGIKAMTFHGTLGKFVMFGGAINMALAISFWGWSPMQKVRLTALLVATLMFSTIVPLPREFSQKFGLPEFLTEPEARDSGSEAQALIDKQP